MRHDQNEALHSLARDLATVVIVLLTIEDDREEHARARIAFEGMAPSLFRDGLHVAPELEVGRALRKMAERRRLTIEGDQGDGKRVQVLLRSGVKVHVELEGWEP